MSALDPGPSYLRWRLLAVLFVLAAAISRSCACPKSCACYVPSEVHCTFRYLTAIPSEIQPAVERINLGYNSLTVLRENDFLGLEHLELLMLHSNTIHSIEDRAFRDLKSLQVLKISYNRVKELNKETFRGLDNLVRLHMDHNHIKFINPEAFYGLTALQLVHLEGNLLQQLHPDTFITLRHSQVFKVSSVKNIHLSDNALTSLPANVFAGCYQLENVYLHGNPWSCDCRMGWFTEWTEKNSGVLKCKRDRKYARGQLCPICESPVAAQGRSIAHLTRDAFACTKPWIHPHLKQRNITLDEGDYTPVSPRDFIAPIGLLEMNVTDQLHNDASISCVVQRPSGMDNLNVTQGLDDEDVTTLTATFSTSLICNIDYEDIQQLWSILATYSDSPMRLERGPLLTRTPEMIFKYRQARPGEDDIFTDIEAEIKASPGWLMQGEVTLQLDRTTTTFSTLHIKYTSAVQLRIESKTVNKDRYSWAMIKRDNQTKTELSVLTGGVAELNCQIYGDPKPSVEWILPDGNKVRAPYYSEDRRIVITDSGRLTLRAADSSDTGLYRCIATNYLDADVLNFRITVLSPDVEEGDVNGVQLSHSLGQNLLLDCGSTGSPEASIQWILPDHTVLDKSYRNRRLYQNGTLGIQGLTERDRGFYRCMAANYLGADLLASQIIISDDGSKSVRVMDTEGSGDEVDPSVEESETTYNEVPSSGPSSRTGQESRTITSNRPYPRVRPSSGRGSGGIGYRRGSPASSRRLWGTRRVFHKSSRKVDPQKFAEFMKKAQGSITTEYESGRTHTKEKSELETGLSGDHDAGSGEDLSEDGLIIIPSSVMTTTENPEDYQNSAMTTAENLDDNQSGTVTTRENLENNQSSVMPTTENLDDKQHSTIATTENLASVMMTTENIDTVTTESYSQSDTTPIESSVTIHNREIQRDETTSFGATYDHSVSPSVIKPYALERNTKEPLKQPITLRFTVTETTDEMQLLFSGETPDTATGAMPLVNAQSPNVTPMMDRPAPRAEPVVHTSTDPESQTTFTAVTTTERVQDEITFHTTQKIKSSRLPAGSTIISRQQIHIITPNKKRQGRRRNFPSRRRIIRPNSITDIQSYLDKLKKPSIKHKGNATVPYTVELTTDCRECGNEKNGKSVAMANSKTEEEQKTVKPSTRPDMPSSTLQRTERPVTTMLDTPLPTSTQSYPVTESVTSTSESTTTQLRSKSEGSSGYMTSADAPEQEPTEDPMTDEPTTTITATTTASKVIRGRIPWHRLFGNKEGQKELLNRLRKPAKPSMTTESTTMVETITTTAPARVTTGLPTAESLAAPPAPQRIPDTPETSSDDSSGSSSTTESEPASRVVTPPPSASPSSIDLKTAAMQTPTTASIYGSRSSSTTKPSPSSHILSAPPTSRTSSKEKTFESSSSGSESGGSGGWFGRRFHGRRPVSGFRRRGFRHRRPVKKTTTVAPTTTTTDMADVSTTFETITTEITDISTTFETTTPEPRTASRMQGGVLSRPLYTPSSHPTTHSTTTYRTTTTPRPYTTPQTQIQSNANTIRVNTNIRLPIGREGQYPTQRPVIRRVRPTVSDNRNRDHLERPRPTAPSSRNTDRSKEKTGTGRTLTFDTLTVLTAEQGYTNTPAPYSSDIDNAISNKYDHITGYETTTTNIIGFEPSTKDMPSKPRIVGGNAASFTVLSNSDAFLPCEAVGDPEPIISWKRFSSSTGSTLTMKGKMGKFEVFKNGTLSIQNANIKDRGQYLCLAENNHGSDKLLVTLSVVSYPSRILEPKIREVKVHSGNTVEMKCKAEGRPVPLVSWILANRTQVRGQNSESGRVTVTPEGTLVIQQVSVFDRGHYKCIASNPAGADTATVRLQVVAAPPGILEDKRQKVKANVGQSLWLPCTAQGNPQPTVHWVLFDGTVLRPQRQADPIVSVFANGTLHLQDLDATDSGKYECIATSSTGSERRVVTLTVERTETAPQIIAASQRRTELGYGDRLHLNCSATGDPKPLIIWRLPSKAIVDQWHRMGSRIQVLDNGTLIIDTLSEKDAGDYLCVARSNVGDDLQLMKVFVSMKPAKIEPKVLGKKQVPYGNDLKVDCKASGAPVPEISWGLPDGTIVNSALQADGRRGGRSKRYILFGNGTLYLNKVGMAEEGDYTCYAENTLGKDEMHVHVTVVTVAPRIRPPSRTYATVKPGGNIRFDCEAVGEPKPKILWMLPSNDMIAASNERYLMHVNGSLDIRDVKLIDAGEYVCMARNTAGDDSKVYKLDMDGNPPVINGYYQNRTVVKDTAAKYSRKFIDCKAEGDPSPQITWIMPDNIFLRAPYYGSRINVHRNGTLEIRNVRPTDTAEFICMARNDGGEAVMVIQLEVTSMLMRPIFRNPFNERVVSRMGKTTVLNCSADGQPAPEIIWLLPNGTRFTGGPNRGSRHHLGNDGTFVIYNPSKEDAGKYRCAAKNKVGYIEKLIVLELGQKPYILTRPRGIIRSVSGDPLFLHCLADGSPRPAIFWTIPAGHVLTRPQVSGRHRLMENGTLAVRETTLQDRGNYVCRARNDAGEAVLTVPVIIIAYPPRITNGPPPSVQAVAGVPVQLNCATIGIPKPEITWELPDRSVLSTAGKGRATGSELLHPQGTLIIQKPTRADSGTYKCLAKNHLGTDSRVTYVRVL